ncbi:hypothetical protein ACWGM0_17985 [Sphingomonas bisphenolicum]
MLAVINAFALFGGIALIWTTTSSSMRFARRVWENGLKRSWRKKAILDRKRYAYMLDTPSYLISQIFIRCNLLLLGVIGFLGIGVASSARIAVNQPPDQFQRGIIAWSIYLMMPTMAFGFGRLFFLMKGVNDAAVRRGRRARANGKLMHPGI